jgi:hypothetical protein
MQFLAAASCLIYRRADWAAVLGESQTLFLLGLPTSWLRRYWLVGRFVRGNLWYDTTLNALKRTRVCLIGAKVQGGYCWNFLYFIWERPESSIFQFYNNFTIKSILIQLLYIVNSERADQAYTALDKDFCTTTQNCQFRAFMYCANQMYIKYI